jgi:hypothetical protein
MPDPMPADELHASHLTHLEASFNERRLRIAVRVGIKGLVVRAVQLELGLDDLGHSDAESPELMLSLRVHRPPPCGTCQRPSAAATRAQIEGDQLIRRPTQLAYCVRSWSTAATSGPATEAP